MAKRLTLNAARCLDCGVTIQSKFTHDFQQCGCPNGAFVDGGLSYSRGGAMSLERIEMLCEWADNE